MRRHAYGSLATGAVLFAASALGVVGTWAEVTSVLVLTFGAFLLAIAMEHVVTPVVTGSTRLPVGTGADPDLAA